MISLLSAFLSIVSYVLKYINTKQTENAGRAKEIVESWARSDIYVSEALSAGKAKLDELTANPDRVYERDKHQRD